MKKKDPLIEKLKRALKGKDGIAMLPTFERFPDKSELEKEQSGLELSKACDFCDRDVWVSLKKRNIKKELTNTIFACYECIAVAAKAHKGAPPEIHNI